MALGPDHTLAAGKFVAAMRPIAGDNVDLKPVRANLDALGRAVFGTLKITDTVSDAAEDDAFWRWVADTATWVTGVRAAFASWTPTTPAETALKAALVAIPAPPAAPTSVQGRLQ